MTRRSVCLGLLVPAVVLGGSLALLLLASGAGNEVSTAARFAALEDRFVKREQEFVRDVQTANRLAPPTRGPIIRDVNQRFVADRRAMLDETSRLIQEHPDDPSAFDGLLLLVGTMGGSLSPELMTVVREHYGRDPRLGRLCAPLGYRSDVPSGSILKEVAAQHPDSRVRAQAAYSLGMWSRTRADTRGAAGSEAEQEKHANLAEAEMFFRQVLHDYPGERSADGTFLLADRARAELARIENLPRLKVGQVAPEIVGKDLEGRPLSLSDERGRVVVVNFWATWCAPCMAMIPEERALVKRLEGRPFRLLGVNCDEPADRQKVRVVRSRIGMTWPSWWDGGVRGPIQTAYDVHQWPTIYVLDPQGIIRAIDVQGEALDEAIDKLLAEMDAPAKPADTP